MLVRRLSAIAVAAALLLGVASASSLGAFDDVALSAKAEPVTACAATETNFYTGVLGGLTELTLAVLTTSDVDYIGFDGLSGDCSGDLRPVVVVIGDGLLSEPAVLSRTFLVRLDQDVSGDAEVLLPVGDTDELNLLGGSLTAQEVRVAFCPHPVDSCSP